MSSDDEKVELRMKEMQEQRKLLLNLYDKREQSMSPDFDYHLLFQGILDSLPLLSTKDMDNCILNRIPSDNGLSFLQCEIGKKYKTFPQTEDELKNIQQLFLKGGKINEGVYGLLVQSSIVVKPGREEAVVVKIPKKWTSETILETFVNFYIINRYVKTIHDLGDDYAQLVSSYGFFTCKQKGSENPCSKKNDDKLDLRENSYLYLIQQYIPSSMSLSEYLNIHKVLPSDILKIMIKIFRTLDILQKSEFKVNHMDLHPGNILLGIGDDQKWNGKVWIIDWARASFTYENKRFENTNSAVGEFYTDISLNENEDTGYLENGYYYPKSEYEINGALHDFGKIMSLPGVNNIRVDLLSRLFPDPEYQDFIKKNNEFLKIWKQAGTDKTKIMKIVKTMKNWSYDKILIYLQLVLNNPGKKIINLINIDDFYDFHKMNEINFEGIDITDLDLRGADIIGKWTGIKMFGFSPKK